MKKANAVAVISQNVSIEAVIQNAIDKGVPVETMERLLAMRRELKAEASKEAYDEAMAAFQSEAPIIRKTKSVKTDTGVIAYRYAPIEDAYSQVKDLILKYGFSYSTVIEMKDKSVKAIVKVTHERGHSEDSPMEVPLGNKTKMMSDSQVVAAAATLAKRYAFMNAFGLLTGGDDTDGRSPRMESYQVIRKVAAEEDEPQGRRSQRPIEEDDTTKKKMSIVRLLSQLDPTIDVKNAKIMGLEIIQRTKLTLKEENFDGIIERLKMLVEEKTGV